MRAVKILLVSLVLSMLMGCSAQKKNETGQEEPITVAAINIQEDLFSIWAAKGYKAAADDYSVTMLHAVSRNDPAAEVQLFNTYANQGIKGIAIMPISETTSIEALRKFNQETGLPISLLNVEVTGSSDFVIGGVTTSHTTLGSGSGKAAAKYIKEKLGGKANIGIITFKSQYPEPAAQRMNGFVDEVKAVNPDVKIVAEAEAWLSDMGIQAAGDILTAHPEVNVLYACNEGGLVGTVMAVKNAGLAGKVVVFGIDGSEQIIAMLRSDDNILQASTAQDAYGMGYKTMEILIKYIKGEGTKQPTIWLEGQVLTREDPSTINNYEQMLKNSQ